MAPVNQDSLVRGDDRLPTLAELFQKLSQYDGPVEGFLAHLVQTQCHAANAEGGAIMRISPQGQPQVLAVFPPAETGTTPPVWLARAAELAPQVAGGGATDVRPLHNPEDLYGQPASRHLVMVSLKGGQGARGLAVYVLQGDGQVNLEARVERLELTIVLMGLHEMRLSLQRRNNDLGRLRVSMDTLAATNEHIRFTAAAMAMCNETASTWQCERVSVGVLKGRYVQLKTMSGTEKISRKMKLVQDIEAAMEESLDQDIEILAPAPPEATYVSRAATELSRQHGPSAVVSLPLRQGGKPVGVATFERPVENPFTDEQIEALRLTCELTTPRLMDLYATDRWFGAKFARGVRKALATVVGAKHTWLKMIAILVSGFLAFAIFVKGDYTASADMTLQAEVRQVIPAPFEGILKHVHVKVDAKVAGGQILAELDIAELRERLLAARVERDQALKTAAEAMNEDNTVRAQIARDDARKAQANINLLEQRIAQASISSPIAGTVVSGDLEKHLGRRYQLGDELFQVAPLDAIRAELLVDEDQIIDVKSKFDANRIQLDEVRRELTALGDDPKKRKELEDRLAELEKGVRGRLTALGKPGTHFEFVVERITPVARPVEGSNVFAVRVRLLETAGWMQPGMSGVAEIYIDRRPYIYIWTRRLVNWVRMKLWL